MRDPFTWSFPLGRLFGVTIRVHVLFPLFALAMLLNVAAQKSQPPAPELPPGLWLDACVLLAMGFVAVLLHELGHCFGARLVDGDAPEVLLWPLGGLAPLEVPHTPRAHFIASAAGPAVNLLICVALGLLLWAYSLRPTLNVWSADGSPLTLRLYKWSEGISYGYSPLNPGDPTKYTAKTDKGEIPLSPAQVEEKPVPRDAEPPRKKEYVWKDDVKATVTAEEPATLERWQLAAARFFWVNWVLFLMNLLPAFPLDGGRLLHSFLWWRGEYRQAMITAVFVGFVTMFFAVVYAMAFNSVLPVLLAWFIYITCRHHWYVLETGGDEPMFGYDFSQGYTSLEREPTTATRARRPNFFQRWLQRRAARRLQREQETREAEERRLDALLEKVQRDGVQALTEEERRFLTRVSKRKAGERGA
jgi:Zn-dependent protease